MIEIIREREPARIGYYQTILESAGIQTFIRNENLSTNEAPIPVFWPALCIVNDADHERALAVIRERTEGDEEKSKTEINCPSCNEPNPGNFDYCWSCGAELSTE